MIPPSPSVLILGACGGLYLKDFGIGWLLSSKWGGPIHRQFKDHIPLFFHQKRSHNLEQFRDLESSPPPFAKLLVFWSLVLFVVGGGGVALPDHYYSQVSNITHVTVFPFPFFHVRSSH